MGFTTPCFIRKQDTTELRNELNKLRYFPHPFYEEGTIKYMPIPSFNEILEANKDVLQRLKEKGD